MKKQVKAFIAKFIPEITDTPAYWNVKIRLSEFGETPLKIQSEYFMEKIISNVPNYIFEDAIRNIDSIRKLKIGDIGCGNGDGTRILYKSFINSEIIGYDFAIKSCFKNNIPFIKADITSFEHNLDIGIISNVLEHFKCPLDILERLTRNIDNIIILVPYNENEPFCIEHRCSLNEYSFPEQIRSHKRVLLKIINCNEVEHKCLDQLLVIYTKR
jgi:trans-aconitate methyltransferase